MELQASMRLVSDSHNSDPPYVTIKTNGDTIIIEIDDDREITFRTSELKKAIELLTSK
jgi:hypothetical protein